MNRVKQLQSDWEKGMYLAFEGEPWMQYLERRLKTAEPLKVHKGDRVFFKPEWQDKGDKDIRFIAVEELNHDGVRVEAQVGLTINPQQVVKLDMIERVEPLPRAEHGWFEIDGIDGVYLGYTFGATWNGFATPSFDKSEADRLMVALRKAHYSRAKYDKRRDEYTTCSAEQPDYDTWQGVDMPITDPPFYSKHVYSIGGYAWVWQQVPDAELKQRLAVAFSTIVRHQLADHLPEILKRNETAKQGVCHTHDFCDANMLMWQAYQQVTGMDQVNADNEHEAVLWSAAWDIAKANRFECTEVSQ